MPREPRKRPLVVVADDEEVIRVLLARRLSLEGLDVETYENGEGALAAVEREFVNVVLTDIKMPGTDGMTVLRKTRETSPDTAVIIMTAYAATETAIEAVSLGAFDYLLKPFDPLDDVVNKVRRALRQQQFELQNRELIRRFGELNRRLKRLLVTRTRELSDAQSALQERGGSDAPRKGQPIDETAKKVEEGLRAIEQQLARSGQVPVAASMVLADLRNGIALLVETAREQGDLPGADDAAPDDDPFGG